MLSLSAQLRCFFILSSISNVIKRNDILQFERKFLYALGARFFSNVEFLVFSFLNIE